jgi:hypothetical protein
LPRALMRASESKGHWQLHDSSAASEPEVRDRIGRTECANFGFAALETTAIWGLSSTQERRRSPGICPFRHCRRQAHSSAGCRGLDRRPSTSREITSQPWSITLSEKLGAPQFGGCDTLRIGDRVRRCEAGIAEAGSDLSWPLMPARECPHIGSDQAQAGQGMPIPSATRSFNSCLSFPIPCGYRQTRGCMLDECEERADERYRRAK